MLARLYICWRWWRRNNLASLLSTATKLVTAQISDLSKDRSDPGISSSSSGSSGSSLATFLPWLQCGCCKPYTTQLPSTCSIATTSSSSASSRHGDNRPSVLPVIDILWLTEELPEISGFQRFLAAALGCYDDAKGHLDRLLLQGVEVRLAALQPEQKPGEQKALQAVDGCADSSSSSSNGALQLTPGLGQMFES
jgi:hypothetical protein